MALEAKSSVDDLRKQVLQAPPSVSIDELCKRVDDIESKFTLGAAAHPNDSSTNILVVGGLTVSVAQPRNV